MSCTLPLSKQLQCPTFDLSEAQTLTVSALTALKKNQQNENDYTDIFKKAQDLADQFNIQIQIPRIANRQSNCSNIISPE